LNPGVNEPATIRDLQSKLVSQRLADAEILYVLSFQPMKIMNLIDSLRTTFDLSVTHEVALDIISNLESGKLLAAFRKTGESEMGDSSDDVYGITPYGLKLLKEFVESLSQIALTMQLGFNQKLVRV
jgi:DNA-binding PadR family transcriptional regulator